MVTDNVDSASSKKLEAHPLANIFPMMSKAEIEALANDIKANGFKEPGLLFEGKILDGRNRYRASCELGVEMNWAEVENSEPEDIAKFDPLAYVLSQNLHRRHLKQSQRAMIAAKMATLKDGKRPSSFDEGARRADAAAMLDVSTASLDRAKHVLDNGCKQLIEAVEACEITVSMAEKLCRACDDKREQSRLVKDGKEAIKLFLESTGSLSLPTARENLFDLVASARSAVADLIEAFKDQHIDTLIGVLRDEIATMEANKNAPS